MECIESTRKQIRWMVGVTLMTACLLTTTAAQAAAPPTPQSWTLQAELDRTSVAVVYGSPDRTGGTQYALKTALLSENAKGAEGSDTFHIVQKWETTLYFDPSQTHSETHTVAQSHLTAGSYKIRQSVYVAYLNDDPADHGRLLDVHETNFIVS